MGDPNRKFLACNPLNHWSTFTLKCALQRRRMCINIPTPPMTQESGKYKGISETFPLLAELGQQKYAMDGVRRQDWKPSLAVNGDSLPCDKRLLRNRVVELDIFAKRNGDVAGADCWRETAANAGDPGATGWVHGGRRGGRIYSGGVDAGQRPSSDFECAEGADPSGWQIHLTVCTVHESSGLEWDSMAEETCRMRARVDGPGDVAAPCGPHGRAEGALPSVGVMTTRLGARFGKGLRVAATRYLVDARSAASRGTSAVSRWALVL
ncbi:hypothetical protein BDZ91DRAFT_769123 [Kalaharituber pfeilii]|nr:hypothetical protein BDZ91DRAFT_769123 [Kalaharituber pfeilii]